MTERDTLTTEVSQRLRKELNSGISQAQRQEILVLWDSWLKSQKKPVIKNTPKDLDKSH